MKVPKARRLKSGTWFIQLRLDGQSYYVTATTERDCRRRAELIKAEHRSGKRMERNEEMTLRKACDAYIAKKRTARASPETVRGYIVIRDHRFPDVMDKPLGKVRDWQREYDKEAARLSPKTMKNTWSFLKSACKSSCGFVLPDIEQVKHVREEHLFLEPDQIKQFVPAAAKSKYAIPMLLCLSSCRSSEVQGLTWDNVDLAHNRIQIKGAVVRDENNQYVAKDDNKTVESARYIPIFIPELRAALEAVEDKTGRVVTARPNTVYRNVNSLCKSLGLPEVGNHGLRHSFASLCYSLEIPVKITMQLGGWSDYNTVMRIYTHLSKKDVGKYTSELEQFYKNAT